MKIAFTTTLFLLLSSTVTPRVIPQDLVARDTILESGTPELPDFSDLEKRRGGGGSGGRGGGSSGGSSGGRSGSGGSSGSRGSSGSSSSRTGSSSNSGGRTRTGSGVRPAYGGSYYRGGAASPYTSGARSPLGLTPFILPAAALAFFPGVWLYGAYMYPYTHHYQYVDEHNHKNESLPVSCLCAQYAECGCDDNGNSTYYESLFNGTQPKNSSAVQVVDAGNGTTIYVNGTLANGTTLEDKSISAAPALMLSASGYWMMVAVVGGMIWI